MKKKQRLYFIVFILVSLGAAVGLALYALKDNVTFFYSPSEVMELRMRDSGLVKIGKKFRVGGLVEKGTLEKRQDNLTVTFLITDNVDTMRIEYKGLLPDLFREGQGVVATGSLDNRGVFVARDLLAKHDENYMPPEVAKALEESAKEKKAGE